MVYTRLMWTTARIVEFYIYDSLINGFPLAFKLVIAKPGVIGICVLVNETLSTSPLLSIGYNGVVS